MLLVSYHDVGEMKNVYEFGGHSVGEQTMQVLKPDVFPGNHLYIEHLMIDHPKILVVAVTGYRLSRKTRRLIREGALIFLHDQGLIEDK